MAELKYRLRQDDFADEERVIRKGLDNHAETLGLSRTGIGCFCYDDAQMKGGVTAHIRNGTLSVKLLWVDDSCRGKGIGARLMRQVEDAARNEGCIVAFVDTMSYQAPGFYLKMGYSEVARIADFHPGHDRIFFKKELI